MNTQSAIQCSLVALGAAALLLAGPLAKAESVSAGSEQTRAAFERADENKDGMLDIDEVVGDAIYVFAAYDRNRDGVLVVDELPRHDPVRFKRADRDGNGSLSLSEVTADKVWEFFEADVKREGVLTLDAVNAYADRIRK